MKRSLTFPSLWLAAVLLLLPAALVAAARGASEAPLPAGIQRVTSLGGITEYALPNGLHILLMPDASKPTTTVDMTVRVGSRYEGAGETGMAHLLEHMMFKGTKRHPSSIMGELSQRGLQANANTWVDRTTYFASMSDNPANLDWYLGWLADSLVNSTILRRDLDSEMTVVRNEMERGENDPDNILLQEVLASAYRWHNYGKVTIGARSDVENVNIEHLQAFYHKYYQPDNTVLVVTGKFDVARTLNSIAHLFGPLPRPKRVLEPTYTIEPVQDGERNVTLRRVGDTPEILLGYHIVAGPDRDYPAAVLATTILGGPSLRLHKALVDKGLAAEVSASTWALAEPGMAFFDAGLKSDQSLDDASTALIAVVEGVAKEPFTEEELARAKNIWLRGFDTEIADVDHFGLMLAEYIAQGDWRLVFLMKDTIVSAKLEDVNRFAREYFVRSNRTEGRFIPTVDPERSPLPQPVDLKARLKDFHEIAATKSGEAFDSRPENLERRTSFGSLSNGMRYAFLEKKTRADKVLLHIALHIGDAQSLTGHDLAGAALANMLTRGTQRLSREELAARLEQLQINLSVSGSAEEIVLALECSADKLADGLALAHEILRTPRLDEQQFEQMKTGWIAEQEAGRNDPASLIGERLARTGNPYPKGDLRYARSIEESLADTRALDIAAVRAFYQDFVGASNATISAVGEFDSDKLKQTLDHDYGDWQSPRPYTRVPRPYIATEAGQFKIDLKDKQNAMLIGELAMPLRENEREFQALRIATHAIGGGEASRLWARIRQRDGLSYDLGAAISGGQQDAHASFEVYAIFAPQNSGHVQSDLHEELVRARESGLTADEVAKAKEAIASEVRLARAQDPVLVGLLGSLLDRKLTPAYLSEVQALRDSISVPEVNAAIAKYLDPEKLLTGVALDPAAAAAHGGH